MKAESGGRASRRFDTPGATLALLGLSAVLLGASALGRVPALRVAQSQVLRNQPGFSVWDGGRIMSGRPPTEQMAERAR